MNLIIAGTILAVFIFIKWIWTGKVLHTGGKMPQDNIAWCEVCQIWATFIDGKCAACGSGPDTRIVIVQAADAWCFGCRRRQYHRIRSAELITCVVCLLPQEMRM